MSDAAFTRYDAAYFAKWYRHPRHRVKSATELQRQVEFVLRFAEWVVGRPVRSVLDVGCGEGNWRALLLRLRPRVHYDGVDPSAYAIARYGRRRGLQLGGIEDLERLPLRESYDLVICCGMLNYLAPAVLRRGLRQVASRTGGVAYLEIFARGDAIEGDTTWPRPKAASWYRTLARSVDLHAVGLHGYVRGAMRAQLSALERTID